MLIKVILIALIAVIFFYFFNNSQKVTVKAWKRLALVGLLFLAVASVIFPEILDDLAKFVGIGRGADLLLYSTVVAFIFVTINIYIKFRDISLKQDKIISKIALIEKRMDERDS